MPTSVTTARQSLTEESARVLDDAVSLAKRRNHSQTTSLHALSALLSPSFSLLRDCIIRRRSSGSCAGYSPRLHFRALELCVGVSLDRLSSLSSSSIHDDFTPPISNSLMAAIKRAQANQRRQPNMYHLNQIHLSNNPISISAIKVELKHFILSILDDPIVSRVFGDAGFRSSDIKFSIIHPPLTSPSRWGSTGHPAPPFLCYGMGILGFAGDENCRRIGEVMIKNKDKNPVLIGVCAKNALLCFKEWLDKEKFSEIPSKIHGLKMVCLERVIGDFVRGEKVGLDMKLKEMSLMVESCNSGPGVVLNLGELKVLTKEESNKDDVVNELVLKLSGLVEVYEKKLWMIGSSANYETYSKFVDRFPSIMKDWDLHPLPITSAKSSFDALSPKSSLMGSFVPFGGLFPTQPDVRSLLSITKQPFTRCNSCNEMYEKELFAVLREGTSISIGSKCSGSSPSWLQRSDLDLVRGGDMLAQIKDVKTTSSEQLLILQRKWDDHCWQLHQIQTNPYPGAPFARLEAPHDVAYQFVSDIRESYLNKGECSTAKHSQHKATTADFPQKSSIRESSASMAYPIHNFGLPLDYKLPSALSVTTDLHLGTIDGSKGEKLKKRLFQDEKVALKHSLGYLSSKQGIINNKEGPNFGDPKLLIEKLSKVVPWQGEAISRIIEIVSSCRSGNAHPNSSNIRGNVCLRFHGPDKIGKRRVAEALADGVFGSRDHLIFVDLSSLNRSTQPHSLFLCQETLDINMSRMTVVDLIARKLCKKPQSVFFLENVDEADPLVQNSLSRAIQTGKFLDSSGREISVKNVIFIVTCSPENEKSVSPTKGFIRFPEEKVLEAKNWEMKVTVRKIPQDASKSNNTMVSLVSAKSTVPSKQETSKRKTPNISDSPELMNLRQRVRKNPKHCLDLNLPLEEADEIDSHDMDSISDCSHAWLEDFMSQADGNVVFNRFDFDALAEKFLKKIRAKFEGTFGLEKTYLEIENEVMVQILGAAWCAENPGAVDEWIENVVGVTIAGAWERVRSTDECVFRLGSCEGFTVNEWALGICLPKSVNLSV